MQLDEKYPADYVSMSYMYATSGMQEESDMVKALEEHESYQNVVSELM